MNTEGLEWRGREISMSLDVSISRQMRAVSSEKPIVARTLEMGYEPSGDGINLRLWAMLRKAFSRIFQSFRVARIIRRHSVTTEARSLSETE